MFQPQTDGKHHPNGWRCSMRVSSQYEARLHGAEWGTTHLLTIRRAQARLLSMTGIPDDRHLGLVFEDTDDPKLPGAPTAAHVGAVCDWIDALPADANLVVHCAQGLRRSTAISLGILARYLTPHRAAAQLHTLRPVADPNRLMVAQWDQGLGLEGKLRKAAERFPHLI